MMSIRFYPFQSRFVYYTKDDQGDVILIVLKVT